jgi:cell division initiation protein
MPDQSSAATEHAIIQEITAPLEHLPDDPVSVVHADFPVALRGYDRMAVDAYVQRTSQLVAELQATRSPEAAVRRALERVGDQISGILQRAHETAEEITAQSRREAEDRLEQARVESAEIAARAAQRVRDLDADTDRIWIERHRIVDDARDLASQLLALAETAAQRFPDDNEPALSAPFDAAVAPAEPFDEESFDEEPETIAASEEPETIAASEEPETIAASEEPETIAASETGDSDEFQADEADEETEHEAANEEEDDVLTDEAPPDDIETTRAFTAEELAQDDTTEEHGSARQETLPPPGESRRSAIPPASQAANRRQSQ